LLLLAITATAEIAETTAVTDVAMATAVASTAATELPEKEVASNYVNA
jgi:hypothetical protein